MKVEFRKSFVRDIKSIADKNLLKNAKEIIETVEKAETINDLPKLKKLKGAEGYFRIRLGDYRLGFALENETVIFVRFLHRKDIYKFFP